VQGDRLRPEAEADIDDIGSLGAHVALVGLDGLDLLGGGTVGIELVDLDAVLVGELLDHLAVVDPIVRKRDDRELPFFLRGLNEGVHVRGMGRLGDDTEAGDGDQDEKDT
jgi:hypothetical protein